jgi:hypothetical protein
MSTEWYYAKDNQQLGPIPPSQLKMMAQGGQLSPEDLVWKEGMAEWQPAGKIKGLFDPGTMPAAATAVAHAGAAGAAARQSGQTQQQPQQYGPGPVQAQTQGPPQSSIGYYNPTAGMGARTANILKGYAPPTGPSGDWPLSDQHLEQLKEAERHRKAIRAAAGLFNTLLLLQIIGLVIQGIALLLALGVLGSPGRAAMAETLMGFAANVAGAVLLYFTSRHTLRCQIWAPITMLAIFAVGAIGLVLVVLGVSSFSGGAAGPAAVPMVVVALLVLIFPAIFIYISARAVVAIPKFRAAPVWCQEALVNAKL